jgi:hypothetical protein
MGKYKCLGLIVAICGSGFFISGCEQNSSREAAETRDTLKSWSSSLDLLEEQSLGARVPNTYVKQMLGRATETLTTVHSQTKLPADVQQLAAVIESRIERLKAKLSSNDQAARP